MTPPPSRESSSARTTDTSNASTAGADSLRIPGVGAPLRRALATINITELQQLNGKDYRYILSLHGVGTKGLQRVLAALREQGGDMEHAPAGTTAAEIEASWLASQGKAPKPQVRVTEGHTGKVAKDIKTRPTSVDPAQFIEELEWPRRIEHGRELLALFNRACGEQPVMWGPTMIGYGETHYASASGREGDWFKIGFSPRKASLTLYGIHGTAAFERLAVQENRLGKFKSSVSCLYINKLEDVDMEVLEELVKAAWEEPLRDLEGC